MDFAAPPSAALNTEAGCEEADMCFQCPPEACSQRPRAECSEFPFEGSPQRFCLSRVRAFDEPLPLGRSASDATVRISLDRSVLIVLEPRERRRGLRRPRKPGDAFVTPEDLAACSPPAASGLPHGEAGHGGCGVLLEPQAKDSEVDSESDASRRRGPPERREEGSAGAGGGEASPPTALSALARASLEHAAPVRSMLCYLCSVKGRPAEASDVEASAGPKAEAEGLSPLSDFSCLNELASRCGGAVWVGPRRVAASSCARESAAALPWPPLSRASSLTSHAASSSSVQRVASQRPATHAGLLRRGDGRLSDVTWDMLWLQVPEPRLLLLRQRQQEAACAPSPEGDRHARPRRRVVSGRRGARSRMAGENVVSAACDLFYAPLPSAFSAGEEDEEERFLKLPSVPVLVALADASVDFFLFDRISSAEAPLVDCCYEDWCAWGPAGGAASSAQGELPNGYLGGPWGQRHLAEALCACPKSRAFSDETRLREGDAEAHGHGASARTKMSPWLIEWDRWWWQKPRAPQDLAAAALGAGFAATPSFSEFRTDDSEEADEDSFLSSSSSRAPSSLGYSVGEPALGSPRSDWRDAAGVPPGPPHAPGPGACWGSEAGLFPLSHVADAAATAHGCGGRVASPASWFSTDAENSIRRFRVPLTAFVPFVTVKKRKGRLAAKKSTGQVERRARGGSPWHQESDRVAEHQQEADSLSPLSQRRAPAPPTARRAWGGTESDARAHGCFRLQFCATSKPDEIVIVWNYSVALWCSVSHRGLFVKRRFWLQRSLGFSVYERNLSSTSQDSPSLPSFASSLWKARTHALAPVQILSLASRNDLLFALTAPPRQHLLIWSLCGVALYAVTLHSYSPLSATPVPAFAPVLSPSLSPSRDYTHAALRRRSESPPRIFTADARDAAACADAGALHGVAVSSLSAAASTAGSMWEAGGNSWRGERERAREEKGEAAAEELLGEGDRASPRGPEQAHRRRRGDAVAWLSGPWRAHQKHLAGARRPCVRCPVFLSLQVRVDCAYAVLTDSDQGVWCIDLDAYFASSPLETASHLLASSSPSRGLRLSSLSGLSSPSSLWQPSGAGDSTSPPGGASASYLCATAVSALLPPSAASKFFPPSLSSSSSSRGSARPSSPSCGPFGAPGGAGGASGPSWVAVLEDRRRLAESLSWATQLHHVSASLSAFPSAFNLLPLVISLKRADGPDAPSCLGGTLAASGSCVRPFEDASRAGVSQARGADERKSAQREASPATGAGGSQHAIAVNQCNGPTPPFLNGAAEDEEPSQSRLRVECSRLTPSSSLLRSSPRLSSPAGIDDPNDLLRGDSFKSPRASSRPSSCPSPRPHTGRPQGARSVPQRPAELPATPAEAFDDLLAECSRVNLSVFFTRDLGAVPIVPQALWRPAEASTGRRHLPLGTGAPGGGSLRSIAHRETTPPAFPMSPQEHSRQSSLFAEEAQSHPERGEAAWRTASDHAEEFAKPGETGPRKRQAPGAGGGRALHFAFRREAELRGDAEARRGGCGRGDDFRARAGAAREQGVYTRDGLWTDGDVAEERQDSETDDFLLFTGGSAEPWRLVSGPDGTPPAVVVFATPAELQVETFLARNQAGRLSAQQRDSKPRSRSPATAQSSRLSSIGSLQLPRSLGETAQTGLTALTRRGGSPSPAPPRAALADLLALSLLRASRAVCAPPVHDRRAALAPEGRFRDASGDRAPHACPAGTEPSGGVSQVLETPFVSASSYRLGALSGRPWLESLSGAPQGLAGSGLAASDSRCGLQEDAGRPRRRWFERPKPEELLELSLGSPPPSHAAGGASPQQVRHQRLLLSHLQSGGNAVLRLVAPSAPGSWVSNPGALWGVGSGAVPPPLYGAFGASSISGTSGQATYSASFFGGQLASLAGAGDGSLVGEERATEDDDIRDRLLFSSPAQFFASNVNAGGGARRGGPLGWSSDASVMLLELDTFMDRSSGALMKLRMRREADAALAAGDSLGAFPAHEGLPWREAPTGGSPFPSGSFSPAGLRTGEPSAAAEDLFALLSAALPPGAQEHLLPLLLASASGSDEEDVPCPFSTQQRSWSARLSSREDAESWHEVSESPACGCAACLGPAILPSWLTGARLPLFCCGCRRARTKRPSDDALRGGRTSTGTEAGSRGGPVGPRGGWSRSRPHESVSSVSSGASWASGLGASASSVATSVVRSVSACSARRAASTAGVRMEPVAGANESPSTSSRLISCRPLVAAAWLERGFAGGVDLLREQETRRARAASSRRREGDTREAVSSLGDSFQRHGRHAVAARGCHFHSGHATGQEASQATLLDTERRVETRGSADMRNAPDDALSVSLLDTEKPYDPSPVLSARPEACAWRPAGENHVEDSSSLESWASTGGSEDSGCDAWSDELDDRSRWPTPKAGSGLGPPAPAGRGSPGALAGSVPSPGGARPGSGGSTCRHARWSDNDTQCGVTLMQVHLSLHFIAVEASYACACPPDAPETEASADRAARECKSAAGAQGQRLEPRHSPLQASPCRAARWSGSASSSSMGPASPHHLLWLLHWPHIPEEEGELSLGFPYASPLRAPDHGAAWAGSTTPAGRDPPSAVRTDAAASSARRAAAATRRLSVSRSLRWQLFASRVLSPWKGLCVSDQAFYLFSALSLFTLSPSQSPLSVLLNLAIFEGVTSAAAFAAANGVALKSLCHLLLFVGLRYRKLEKVKFALGFLPEPQQMVAVRMLILYVLHGYSTERLVVPVRLPPASDLSLASSLPPSSSAGLHATAPEPDARGADLEPTGSETGAAPAEAGEEWGAACGARREVVASAGRETWRDDAGGSCAAPLEHEADFYTAVAPGLYATVVYLLDLLHSPSRECLLPSASSLYPALSANAQSPLLPPSATLGCLPTQPRAWSTAGRPLLNGNAVRTSSPPSLQCAALEALPSSGTVPPPPPSSSCASCASESARANAGFLQGGGASAAASAPASAPAAARDAVRKVRRASVLAGVHRGRAPFAAKDGFPLPAICILAPHAPTGQLREATHPRDARLSPSPSLGTLSDGADPRLGPCGPETPGISPALVGLQFPFLAAEAIERARAAAARCMALAAASLNRGASLPSSALSALGGASAPFSPRLFSDPAVSNVLLLFGDRSLARPEAPSGAGSSPAGASHWTTGASASASSLVSAFGAGGGERSGVPAAPSSCAAVGAPSSASARGRSGEASAEGKRQERLLLEAGAAAAAAAASSLLAVDRAFGSRLLAIILQFINALIGRRVMRKIQICEDRTRRRERASRLAAPWRVCASSASCPGGGSPPTAASAEPIEEGLCDPGGLGEEAEMSAEKRAQQVTEELSELTAYLQFIRALQQALIVSLPSARVCRLSAAHFSQRQAFAATRRTSSAEFVRGQERPPRAKETDYQRRTLRRDVEELESEEEREATREAASAPLRAPSCKRKARRLRGARLPEQTRETDSDDETAQEPSEDDAARPRSTPPSPRPFSSPRGEQQEREPRGERISFSLVSQAGGATSAAVAGGEEEAAAVQAEQGEEREKTGKGRREEKEQRQVARHLSAARAEATALAAAVTSCSIRENLWPADADVEAVIRDGFLTGRVSSALVWLERRRAAACAKKRAFLETDAHSCGSLSADERIAEKSRRGTAAAAAPRSRWLERPQNDKRDGGEEYGGGEKQEDRRRSVEGSELGEETDETAMETLQKIGRRMAFQLFCNQQIEFFFVGMQMLRQLGVNVPAFCMAAAFSTTRPLVRRRLLRHLRHMGRLSRAQLRLIDFLQVLEQEFTNPCYTAEFNRQVTLSLTLQQPVHILDSVPPLSSLLSLPLKPSKRHDDGAASAPSRSTSPSPKRRAAARGEHEALAEEFVFPPLSGRVAGVAVWPPGGFPALWMSLDCAGIVGAETKAALLARLAPFFLFEDPRECEGSERKLCSKRLQAFLQATRQREDGRGREDFELCGDRVVASHSLSDEDRDYTMLSLQDGAASSPPALGAPGRREPTAGRAGSPGASATPQDMTQTAALISHYSNDAVTAWAHLEVGDVDDLSCARMFGVPAFPHNLSTGAGSAATGEGLDSHTAAAAAALNEALSAATGLDGGDAAQTHEPLRQETGDQPRGADAPALRRRAKKLAGTAAAWDGGGKTPRVEAEKKAEKEAKLLTRKRQTAKRSGERGERGNESRREEAREEGAKRERERREDDDAVKELEGDDGGRAGAKDRTFTDEERWPAGDPPRESAAEQKSLPQKANDGSASLSSPLVASPARRGQHDGGVRRRRRKDFGGHHAEERSGQLAEETRLMKMRGICWHCRHADIRDLDFSFCRASVRLPWRGLGHRRRALEESRRGGEERNKRSSRRPRAARSAHAESGQDDGEPRGAEGEAARRRASRKRSPTPEDAVGLELSNSDWTDRDEDAAHEAQPVEGDRQSGAADVGVSRRRLRNPEAENLPSYSSFLEALEMRLPKRSILSGYLCVKLAWMARWSRGTSLRILLERRYVSLLDELRSVEPEERKPREERSRTRRRKAAGEGGDGRGENAVEREKKREMKSARTDLGDDEREREAPDRARKAGFAAGNGEHGWKASSEEGEEEEEKTCDSRARQTRRPSKRGREGERRRDKQADGLKRSREGRGSRPSSLQVSSHRPQGEGKKKTVFSIIASSLSLHGRSFGLWRHALDYFISHHDWRGVSLWELAVRGVLCESTGDLAGFPLLLRRLAKAGILFNVASEQEAEGGEASEGEARRRLKQANRREDEQPFLSLSRAFMPLRRVSPFHCFLLLLFIANEVPGLVSAHLQVFRLGCTYAAVRELKRALRETSRRLRAGAASGWRATSVSSSLSARAAEDGEEPNEAGREGRLDVDSAGAGSWGAVGGGSSAYWPTVLLLGRLGNSALFATALHQAAWLLLKEERTQQTISSSPLESGELPPHGSSERGQSPAGDGREPHARRGGWRIGQQRGGVGERGWNRDAEGERPGLSLRQLVAYDSEHVGFISLNSLAFVGRPLLFLASLMLLPLASALDAVHADADMPWRLQEETLRAAIEDFPDLFAAYYPDEAQPRFSGVPSSASTSSSLSYLSPLSCAGPRLASARGTESLDGDNLGDGRRSRGRLSLPLFELVLCQQHKQRMEGLPLRGREGGGGNDGASWTGAAISCAEGLSRSGGVKGDAALEPGRRGRDELPSPNKTPVFSAVRSRSGEKPSGVRPRDPECESEGVESLEGLLPPCVVSAGSQGGELSALALATWRGDVSLFTLLSDITGMDAARLLRPLPLFERLFKIQRDRQRRRRLRSFCAAQAAALGTSEGGDRLRRAREEAVSRQEEAEGERVLQAWFRSGRAFSSIKADPAAREGGGEDISTHAADRADTSPGGALALLHSPAVSEAASACTAEGLSIAYYIAQGRPAMAFHLLFALRAASSSPTDPAAASLTVAEALSRWAQRAADSVSLNLSEEEQELLHDVALTVALHNMLNDGVVAAALCFLELCGLETERVRVDALSARQIYLHRKGLQAQASAYTSRTPRPRRPRKEKKGASARRAAEETQRGTAETKADGAEGEKEAGANEGERARDSRREDGDGHHATAKTDEGDQSETASRSEGVGGREKSEESSDAEDATTEVEEDDEDESEADAVPDVEAARVIDLFLSFPKPKKRVATTTALEEGDAALKAGNSGTESGADGARGRGADARAARSEGAEKRKKAEKDEADEEESSAGISSPHLLAALRMLEEATWSLDPNLATTQAAAATPLSLDSPWHLVGLFCRVHQLPRSLTLLHELARNDDWLLFLHEGDLQQCPPQTMTNIIDGYFREAPLRHHLRIVVRSVERPTAPSTARFWRLSRVPASALLSDLEEDRDAGAGALLGLPLAASAPAPGSAASPAAPEAPLSLEETRPAPAFEGQAQERQEGGLAGRPGEAPSDPRAGKARSAGTSPTGLHGATLRLTETGEETEGPRDAAASLELANGADVMSVLLKSRVSARGASSASPAPGFAESPAPALGSPPVSSLALDFAPAAGVGQQLLLHALKVCSPRLSVYAACFADADAHACLNAWLYMQTRLLLLLAAYRAQRARERLPLSDAQEAEAEEEEEAGAFGGSAKRRGADEEDARVLLPRGAARRTQAREGRRLPSTLEGLEGLGDVPTGPNGERQSSLLELTLLGLYQMETLEARSGREARRGRENRGKRRGGGGASQTLARGGGRGDREGPEPSAGQAEPDRGPRRTALAASSGKRDLFQVVAADRAATGFALGVETDREGLVAPAFFPTAPAGHEEDLLLWLRDPRHAGDLVLWLCETGLCSLVIRAFRLFDERAVVLDVLLFFRAFLQCRFDASERLLRRFVRRRDALLAKGGADAESKAELESKNKRKRRSGDSRESDETRSRDEKREVDELRDRQAGLPLVPHGLRLADALIHFLLNKHPLFRRQLLAQLHEAAYCSSLSLLFHAYVLLEEHRLPAPLDFRSDCGELLDALISCHKYADARRWRRLTGLRPSLDIFITVHEVTHLLASFKEGGCWADGRERLKTWIRSYELFKLHGFPGALAALFLLDVAAKLEQELFARDQAMLLAMALQLLLSAAASPSSPASGAADAGLCSREALVFYLSRCVFSARELDAGMEGRRQASPLQAGAASERDPSSEQGGVDCPPSAPFSAPFPAFFSSSLPSSSLLSSCLASSFAAPPASASSPAAAGAESQSATLLSCLPLQPWELACVFKTHSRGRRRVASFWRSKVAGGGEDRADEGLEETLVGPQGRPGDARGDSDGESDGKEAEAVWESAAVVSLPLLQDIASRLLLLLAAQSIAAAEAAVTPFIRPLEQASEQASSDGLRRPLADQDAALNSLAFHHPLAFDSYDDLRERVEALLPAHLPALPFRIEAALCAGASSPTPSPASAEALADGDRPVPCVWGASCATLLLGSSRFFSSPAAAAAACMPPPDGSFSSLPPPWAAPFAAAPAVAACSSRGFFETATLLRFLQRASSNLINSNRVLAAKCLVARFSPCISRRLQRGEEEKGERLSRCERDGAEERGQYGRSGGMSRNAVSARWPTKDRNDGETGGGIGREKRRGSQDALRKGKGDGRDSRSPTSRSKTRRESGGPSQEGSRKDSNESPGDEAERREEPESERDKPAVDGGGAVDDLQAQLQLLADDVALAELLLRAVKVFSLELAESRRPAEGLSLPSGEGAERLLANRELDADARENLEGGEAANEAGAAEHAEELRALKEAIAGAACFSHRWREELPALLPHQLELFELLMEEEAHPAGGAALSQAAAAAEAGPSASKASTSVSWCSSLAASLPSGRRRECLGLLEQLLRRCSAATLPFSTRLLVCLAVARLLRWPLAAVVKQNQESPAALLLALLQRVGVPTAPKPRLALCRHYLDVSAQSLSSQAVAQAVVCAFVAHQQQEFRESSRRLPAPDEEDKEQEEVEECAGDDSEDLDEEEVAIEWFEWPLSLLHQFLAVGGSGKGVGDEALRVLRRQVTLWRCWNDGGCSDGEEDTRAEDDACAHASDWTAARLPSQPLPLECEVELAILAYSAFASSSAFAGVAELLKLLDGRLDVYVDSGRFYLLCRLLTAVPAFQGLERALE
ncbi:hypothetical protein BESB_061820 [Besnoitia besnoiti]|uniref:Spatacsin C-terminal domain-containing protein n=1 Tax=Besnoitia besnoiti TaxID=94643 RepID=A0A2A9MBE5_BESBE|nr:hypothetical protein BESB_061820 [Besnoitia besnoiti]PFH35295.1 hypothetical protein BESB_061820 [Besnoitia besnoiti]